MNIFRRKKKQEPVRVDLIPRIEYSAILPPISQDISKKIDVDQLPSAAGNRLSNAPYEYSYLDGDKCLGGFGNTQLKIIDYWTLRQRSTQLFQENLYARGIIRRLINNEINTGLTLESVPDESILGLDDDALGDWSEDIENRFSLWARSPKVCDYEQKDTFYSLQKNARLEALVTGDCLVVMRIDQRTRLPSIQLISGNSVATPFGISGQRMPNGNRIQDGVEMDDKNRHLAYHIVDDLGKDKRIAAYGERSGRRVAWLVYGTEKRIDEVRGVPLLTLVLQSLKEIDRYRDSAQRKAVVNSFLAMFIQKDNELQGTRPLSGGAVRRSQFSQETPDSHNPDTVRRYDIEYHIPGVVMQELQTGETPKAFGSDGTDAELGSFEKVIVHGISWSLEMPPEILTLVFNANYSASQAAINEFKLYQNRIRVDFGEHFCQPVYQEWFVSEVLNDRVQASGFIEAWRDPVRFDQVAAWLNAGWYGPIKPSTDILKQAKGYQVLVANNWITNSRVVAEVGGVTSFRKTVRRLKRERELLDDAGLINTAMISAVEDASGTEPEEVPNLRAVENG